VAKAGGKGILLWDYLKSCDEPEHVVRMKLDRGELRHTWIERDGTERASDDGGPQWPEGWWLRAKIGCEEVKPGNDTSWRWVSGPDYGPDVSVGRKYRVRVFPAVVSMAQKPRLGRPSSAHSVLQEAIRRLCAGDLPTTRKEFLHQLEKWLSKAHPEARPMAAKTIGDHLSSNTEVRALLPKEWTRRS
jgi:hypothetical protein